MDSMAVNKVCGAVLTAGIAFMVCGLLAQGLVHPTELAHSAIKIDVAPPPAPAGAAPAGPAPIEPLLASADPKAGEEDAAKACGICHNFAEGAGAKIGPPLYGVLGRERASVAGYSYSNALKGKPGKWTYDTLNEWLYKPSAFAPGTKMGFAGYTNDKTRAAVIAYLRTLSPNPEPLPK
jgi:cytochrome c